MRQKLADLEERARRAEEGGGAARAKAQREKGKLTARERVAILLDPGSFSELGRFVEHRCHDFGLQDNRPSGDGVVAGHGTIDGRTVHVFSQDFTVFGGSLSSANAEKIVNVMDLAIRNGRPVIGLCDSGGARIQEGVASLGGYADLFLRNTLASGVVPQVSVILGPCAGGAVYSPAITDFVFVVDGISQMFVTGPDVVKTVTHEEVTHEELGGAEVHASRSGVAHFRSATEAEAILGVRRLLRYLPSNNHETPPPAPVAEPPAGSAEQLLDIVPDDPGKSYDVLDVIRRVADAESVLEVQPEFARNIVTAFVRLGGRSAGVIANQPAVLAGVLDIDASMKAARFIRFCDAFNIPLVTFEDVPGFMPGVDQEHSGIIRHGAKLLYAYCEATVPKLTVILRKAYGGAYDVMSSKHIRGDLNLAWPTAEIAVMGAKGAVNILHRREIAAADDPSARAAELEDAFRERFAHPYRAAALGFLDDVVDPRTTRSRLISALEALAEKRDRNPPKKHGNIPL